MDEVTTGTIGEHICCTRLLKLGFAAQIVNLKTTDLIVDVRNHLIRVQVKSSWLTFDSNRPNRSSIHFPCCYSGKKKPLNQSHCDIVAFVNVMSEKVYFLHISEIMGQASKRIKKKFFEDPEVEIKSWVKALKRMGVIK